MDISIRKTIKKDLRKLKKITTKVIKHDYSDFLKKELIDSYLNSGASEEELYKGWKKGRTITADGEICGYAIMQTGKIHIMMIDSGFQRKGLGSALINHCEKLLFEHDAEINLECFQENKKACDFYLKNSWKIKETRKDENTGLNRVFFHKQKPEADVETTGLSSLGMDTVYQSALDPDLVENGLIARVTGVRKNLFLVNNGREESLVSAMGRIHKSQDINSLFPATGDWVVLNEGRISSVLPRKNALSRGASGRLGKKDSMKVQVQVIAANIDYVFIVCGLDRDFNVRRIERYLTLVYQCGCSPVIILSKADLHESPDPFVSDVEEISFGVPVHPLSSISQSGISSLSPYLSPGKTVALLGSSGAGKSTLVNLLAGKEIQATHEVSSYAGKGMHTTTTRDLISLPGGGLLIDNPGIREIAFGDVNEVPESSFPDIEAWAAECRFSDCTHTEEPGCRVLEACNNGELKQKRLESYRKQMRELSFLALRKNKSADRVEKERWKWVAQHIKQLKKSGKMQ